jgi:hypothetical protein
MYTLRAVGEDFLLTQDSEYIDKLKYNITIITDMLMEDGADFSIYVYKNWPGPDEELIYRKFYYFSYEVCTEAEEWGSLEE